MMSDNNNKNAPIFDALDFPLESFVLFKDGRQWKQVAQDRKALYVQIAKHGAKAWPGINGLMRKTGFSHGKVFNILADLKELGCIADATDSKGRKYSGEHGSRVRVINNDALLKPGQATGWLSFKKAGLLIRIVSGVQNSEQSLSSGVQNSSSGVQNSSSGVQNSEQESRTHEAGIQSKDGHERTTPKELPERTNQTPKAAGWDWSLLPPGMPNVRKQDKAAVEALVEKFGADIVRGAVGDWLTGRQREAKSYRKAWEDFAVEAVEYCEQRQTAIERRELGEQCIAEHERQRVINAPSENRKMLRYAEESLATVKEWGDAAQIAEAEADVERWQQAVTEAEEALAAQEMTR